MALVKRRRTVPDPIDQANQKSDADFVRDYLEPGAPDLTPWTTTWTHPRSGRRYRLSLARSGRMDDTDLEACYGLVEQTSRADYEASAQKWRPAHKRQEMREDDLRYIVVRAAGEDDEDGEDGEDGEFGNGETIPSASSKLNETRSAHDSICAFTSLMPTYEDGFPVVYCYEIHLQPDLRGTGLGALLLGFLGVVAHNLPPVRKVMLTCFLSNGGALGFYRRLGFTADAASPVPRTLRGGKTFVPDYMILSKPVARKPQAAQAALDEDTDGKKVAKMAKTAR